MEGGLLSLKWNDHSHTFFDMLSTIRRKESYCDVTLVCEGRFYPVHKLVLSTCSEFFDGLFSRTDCKHPVVIVANVSYKDLESLLNYMYLGEVNVLQTELGGLMKAAEVLRIKGLAEPTKPQEKEVKDKRPTPTSSESSGSSPKRKAGDNDAVSPPPKRSSPIKGRPDRRDPNNPLTPSKAKDSLISPPNNSADALNSNERLATVKDIGPSQLEPGVSLPVGGEEQDSSEKAVRPEVKMEEVLMIKDEPGSWFEEGSDNAPYSEQDPAYDYNQQTVNYPGTCVAWALSPAAQPHPVESHLPQGVPGASGLQGIGDPVPLDMPANTKHRTVRGCRLYVGGFSYTKNKTRGLREYWRCQDRRCSGSLVLHGKEVIKIGTHIHPPDSDGKTSSDIIIKPTLDVFGGFS